MVEREQVDLTKNFLVSLMEEQLGIQQHVMIDVNNQPIVHNGDTLRHMASRIVEEATTVSPRGLAQDVLARAGIDNRDEPAEPKSNQDISSTLESVLVNLFAPKENPRSDVPLEGQKLGLLLVMKIVLVVEQERLLFE